MLTAPFQLTNVAELRALTSQLSSSSTIKEDVTIAKISMKQGDLVRGFQSRKVDPRRANAVVDLRVLGAALTAGPWCFRALRPKVPETPQKQKRESQGEDEVEKNLQPGAKLRQELLQRPDGKVQRQREEAQTLQENRDQTLATAVRVDGESCCQKAAGEKPASDKKPNNREAAKDGLENVNPNASTSLKKRSTLDGAAADEIPSRKKAKPNCAGEEAGVAHIMTKGLSKIGKHQKALHKTCAQTSKFEKLQPKSSIVGICWDGIHAKWSVSKPYLKTVGAKRCIELSVSPSDASRETINSSHQELLRKVRKLQREHGLPASPRGRVIFMA
jgi:hypothetical protein